MITHFDASIFTYLIVLFMIIFVLLTKFMKSTSILKVTMLHLSKSKLKKNIDLPTLHDRYESFIFYILKHSARLYLSKSNNLIEFVKSEMEVTGQ